MRIIPPKSRENSLNLSEKSGVNLDITEGIEVIPLPPESESDGIRRSPANRFQTMVAYKLWLDPVALEGRIGIHVDNVLAHPGFKIFP